MHIYRPPESLSEKQQDVLLNVWSTLLWAALNARNRGMEQVARSIAEDTREFVGVFGVRYTHLPKSKHVA